VGIFSIRVVLCAVDALEENMKRGLSTFGSDVVSISKWPYSGEDEYGNADNFAEYRWWEYLKRPSPDIADYKFLKTNSTTAAAVAMEMLFFKGVEYGRKSISGSNADIKAVTYHWNHIADCNLHQGRYFTAEEADRGAPVCIIGHEVWRELFGSDDFGSDDCGSEDCGSGARGTGVSRTSDSSDALGLYSALGQKIKVAGKALSVIGVCSKQGESMLDIGGNLDMSVIIPLEIGRRMVNPSRADISIYARPREGVKQQEFCDELMVLMRSQRRLYPSDKNNFSINRMAFLLDVVEGILAMVNRVGWVIAGFSLLTGGFGIANIMFVSVKERTNIIGIQKALGAKRQFIVAQFLMEALLLCLAGGLLGILLAWGLLLAGDVLLADDVLRADDVLLAWDAAMPVMRSGMFEMRLSGQNIFTALAVSCVIGVLSGLAPAISAAAMSPVEAINSK
jgi:putative ABC transport system permease protein